MAPVERRIARRSLVGDKRFFEPEEFPWAAPVEAQWQAIRAEPGRRPRPQQ